MFPNGTRIRLFMMPEQAPPDQATHRHSRHFSKRESPERVALIQRLTWAFLRSALYPADTSWSAASAELTESTDPLGRIESK